MMGLVFGMCESSLVIGEPTSVTGLQFGVHDRELSSDLVSRG